MVNKMQETKIQRAACPYAFAFVCCVLSLLFILALTSLAHAASPTPDDDSNKESIYVERSFDEELILSVNLKHYTLNDGLIAYQHQTGVLLPLGEMASSFEFPILVNTKKGIAEGWFLRENRTFYLDVLNGELKISGREVKYDKNLIELHHEDIYIDSSLLAEWFPLKAEVDLPLSMVKITTLEPLPLEEKLARQVAQSKIGQTTNYEEKPLPALDVPYSAFYMPSADVSMNFDYTKNNGSSASTDGSYNVNMSGDMLFMSSNLAFSGNEERAINNMRLTLERKSTENDITPLNLSEVTIGDVYSPSINLMTSGRSGRGITFSNFPVESVREFDRITLRGDLQTGWEVELYHNDSLIDAITTPDEDNRYEFKDISLLFGPNVLKLVFYGPQGQRHEEIKSYNVGSDAISPGEHYFSVSINQDDEDIFESINNYGSTSSDEDKGTVRGVIEYSTGLTTRISAEAALASVSIDGKREHLVKTGLLSTFFGSLSRFNVVKLLDGGEAFEFSSQFQISEIRFNISHEMYGDDFYSEDIDGTSSNRTESITKLSANGNIPEFSIFPRLSYGFNVDQTKKANGEKDIEFQNRLSGTINRVNFTNNLTATKYVDYSTNQDTPISGDFLVNTSNLFDIDSLSIRGSIDYDIKPESAFNSVSLTSDYTLDDTTGLRFGITKQLTSDETTTFTTGINKDFQAFALSADSSYADNGDFSIGLSVSFSVDTKGNGDTPSVYREKISDNGAILSRVFLDKNGDGIFNEGDEPIENAALKLGRRTSTETTDENGFVKVSSLSTYKGINVALDTASLEDPYWMPTVEGNYIIPRPGSVSRIDFPVSTTGEIDGTAFFMDETNKLKEISNVEIQLLNNKGEVVRTEKTAFDGFYLFVNVLPGEYILRIDPEQVKRLGLEGQKDQVVKIESDGSVINGIDFYLSSIATENEE